MPITEPSTTGSGLRGSPSGRLLALSANFLTKASAIFWSTISRSVLMQICPLLAKQPKAAPLTASSRSASSSTTIGALPPSSSTTGFRCLAQVIAMILPTRVLPVKLIRRTAGCATIASTTAPASAGALVM